MLGGKKTLLLLRFRLVLLLQAVTHCVTRPLSSDACFFLLHLDPLFFSQVASEMSAILSSITGMLAAFQSQHVARVQARVSELETSLGQHLVSVAADAQRVRAAAHAAQQHEQAWVVARVDAVAQRTRAEHALLAEYQGASADTAAAVDAAHKELLTGACKLSMHFFFPCVCVCVCECV
jgi:hypothetical protein